MFFKSGTVLTEELNVRLPLRMCMNMNETLGPAHNCGFIKDCDSSASAYSPVYLINSVG